MTGETIYTGHTYINISNDVIVEDGVEFTPSEYYMRINHNEVLSKIMAKKAVERSNQKNIDESEI